MPSEFNRTIEALLESLNERYKYQGLEIRSYNPTMCQFYIDVIRKAFEPVAEALEMTKDNFPASGAFINKNVLSQLLNKNGYLFGLFKLGEEEPLIGTIAVTTKDWSSFKVEKLSVLPEFGQMGYGKHLMDFAEILVRCLGGQEIKLGLVDANTRLKNWYTHLGYEVKKIKGYKGSRYQIAFMSKKMVHLNDKLGFCLLTHEREKERQTNTGQLIKAYLPRETQVFYWNRVSPPTCLIDLLKDPDYKPILVFPLDEVSERTDRYKSAEQIHYVSKESSLLKNCQQTPLFIILDGTWKEAKKMLRKSPYLEGIPFISLINLEKTAYTLRRNKDEGHICTVEVAMEILRLRGEDEAISHMKAAFLNFVDNYHR